MSKYLAVNIAIFMIVANVWAAGEEKAGASSATLAVETEIKIYKRLIPADVLRDDIPNTFEESYKDVEWKKAIEAEAAVINKKQTWTVVAEEGRDRIHVIWVFSSKNNCDDFPGMCFASTRCATVEPGKTWDLTPFCGRSTCVRNEKDSSKLLELVEDCGPLPLENDKCKLDREKTNKTAPFPHCCPMFTCEAGVKLEYPDMPHEEPSKKE